ncbi:unnamed protein product, partial [Mesorhabditis belari]|uniref:Secreted protein n=1 Tax=Mesorhabditis belari TaxID=2138241 RepID=A0AAF3FH95_9BILA
MRLSCGKIVQFLATFFTLMALTEGMAIFSDWPNRADQSDYPAAGRVARTSRTSRANPPSLNVYCLLHMEICNRAGMHSKRSIDTIF